MPVPCCVVPSADVGVVEVPHEGQGGKKVVPGSVILYLLWKIAVHTVV